MTRIGVYDNCRKFVKKNLIQSLRKNAKRFNLDTSQHFYQAFAETVYATVDELDQMFIESSNNIAGRTGADMIAVLLVGQKMFVITLGDLHCYLTKRTEVIELCIPLNHVDLVHSAKTRREEETQEVLQRRDH